MTAKIYKAAALITCCATSISTSSSEIAATKPNSHNINQSYNVWSNNNNNTPRRQVEKRRRLEQDHYRRLYNDDRDGVGGYHNIGDDETDNNNNKDNNNIRQLGSSMSSMHSKGNNKKNEDKHVQEEVQKLEFMLLGGADEDTATSTTDHPPPTSTLQTQTLEQQEETEEDLSATNLRKYTRIGGTSYSIPPSTRYPYMASLQLEGHSSTQGKYDIHMCGGTLVAPDMVLTSAHCAKYKPEGTYGGTETYQAFNGIEIGKSNLDDNGPAYDPYSLETYRLAYENLIPEKLHIHPSYNEETYENDVMLVKVYGISRYPPAKLSRDTYEETGSITALGWGADSAQSEKRFSNILKSAQMDLIPTNTCRATTVHVQDPITDEISQMSLHDHIYNDMICAKSDERYMCYGDAGGPTIIEGSNGDEDEVYGLLSWGYGCVNHNYPAVITKISDHYNWIRQMICNKSSDPPSYYDCPQQMSSMSSTSSTRTQTVTLKLKLDRMAVETGFVIETLSSSSSSNREIVAQRQTGYYKSEKNELILESMNIPTNQCYKLILLDSYGDGFCCDMGGGSGTLYLGSDTSYYTGNVLVEVSGTFEFENYGEFCLGSATLPSSSSSSSGGNSSGSGVGTGADSITTMSHSKNTTPPPDPPTPPPVMPPATSPPQQPEQPKESFSSTSTSLSSSSWSGPVDNPEFEYCTQFCSNGSTSRSMNGMMCGNYECLQTSNVATSDSQEVQYQDHPPPPPSQEETPTQEETGPLTSTQFYTENSEYYLTVQIQFDDNPQEVSWVLYDLTTNEVRVFVDFDEYPKNEFANRLLTLKVTMDGPELGEKQYAFTVYDNASNGLCCDHGQGYYKVYLGDVEDDLYLLGDDAFDFSSSYYFTLFEDESHGDDIETTSPVTSMPLSGPTRAPTTQAPTTTPTTSPSSPPSSRPTTAEPTEAWEVQRPEDEEAIGARWSTRTKTFPGVFNDVGGDDQHKFKYSMNRSDIHNAASIPRQDSVTRMCIVTVSLVLIYMFALAVI